MVTKSKTGEKPGPRGPLPGKGAHVLVIEARFYEDLADALVDGAVAALNEAGATHERIAVPGALEIPQALLIAVTTGKRRFEGAVALGCVIRGETAHYDIVCNNANHWLMQVAIQHAVPTGNGILTVDKHAQAWARAEGGMANKGGDAARAALTLIELARALARQR